MAAHEFLPVTVFPTSMENGANFALWFSFLEH